MKLFLALLALVIPTSALAQAPCLPHDKMVGLLGEKYSEQRVSVGLATTGRLLEIFTTADGETWTIVITTPDGASCAVAAGKDWLDIEPEGDGT